MQDPSIIVHRYLLLVANYYSLGTNMFYYYPDYKVSYIVCYRYSTAVCVYGKYNTRVCVEKLIQHEVKLAFASRHPLSAVFFIHISI